MAPDMLLGAVLVLAGMGMGRFWPARKRIPKPLAPVCGCDHDLAYHEPDGDGGGTICHGTVKTSAPRPDYDTPAHYIDSPCGCQQYSGPRIIDPGYVARELTDGTR